MIKINAIPRGQKTVGSSRIRCFGFLDNLPQDEFEVSYKRGFDCDVIYLQKLSRKEEYDLVVEAKKKGLNQEFITEIFKAIHVESIKTQQQTK